MPASLRARFLRGHKADAHRTELNGRLATVLVQVAGRFRAVRGGRGLEVSVQIAGATGFIGSYPCVRRPARGQFE